MRSRAGLAGLCRYLVAPGFMLALICQGATAQSSIADKYPDLNKVVFTKSNRDLLCVTEGSRRIVSRVRLAWKLIGVSGAITSIDLLRSANREGIPTENAEKLDDNAKYFVSSDTPFGINRDYTKEQKDAADRYLPVQASLLVWLRRGHALNKDFELVGPAEPPDAERYFQSQSAYEIVCKGEKPQGGVGEGPGAPAGPDKGGAAGWLKNIVVRKTVADIAVSSSELKKASGATLSYTDDEHAGKSVLSVEGLVGVVVAGTGADRAQGLASRATASGPEPRDLYWYKVTPYVYYKSISSRPGSPKDVDYVSPGLAGNLTWVSASGSFAFDLQVEASSILDSQSNSRMHDVGFRLSPSFYDGSKVWLGAPIGFGNLYVRPDLALVAYQYFVEAAGSNSELAGADAYASLGFDATADIYIDGGGSLMSNLIGKVGYTYRDNSGGVVDVTRLSATLSYVLGTNFTLDLSYANGRDFNTLQQEQRWTLGLSFRN